MTYQRPQVNVDTGELAAQCDDTWAALVGWGTHRDPPRFLVKDGVLARATERALEPYDRYSLREEASRAAQFTRAGRGGTPTAVYPPNEVIDSILRRDPREYVGAPRVSAVVDVPIVAKDGRLVTRPGLHESGVYFNPAEGLEDVDPHFVETPEDVRAARDFLLDELLGDFDFMNPESRANALGLVLLPFLRHFIGDDPTPLHAITASSPGSGKGLALTTPILTEQGWRTMADLQPGDTVYTKDGSPTSVTHVSDVHHRDCYEVTFSDKSTLVADDTHRWLVLDVGDDQRIRAGKWKVVNTLELLERPEHFRIEVNGAPRTPKVDLPLDPYLFGYWLGDGGKHAPVIAVSTPDLAALVSKIKAAGYEVVSQSQTDENCWLVRYGDGKKGSTLAALRNMGVWHNKHVPDYYLSASPEQRLELLRGLMDSDGSAGENGTIIFGNTNERLALAVHTLVRSLGEIPSFKKRKAKLNGRVVSDLFEVHWSPRRTGNVDLIPFALPRKVDRLRARPDYRMLKIERVVRTSSVPTKCIMVDHESSTYLAGKSLIPTHNSYLAQACLIPGCGLIGIAPEPKSDDELRKLITSSLLSARPAIVFDNVSSRMASGTLASALTSRVWQDRVLGQSKEVSLPIRCAWVTTGNNWDATHELVDRVCPIQLEPRGGTPARRRGPSSFKHSDLHGWAMRNRVALVRAALTLVTHWLEGTARLRRDGTFIREETRQQSEQTLGSFERWADAVGGVLASCEVKGFLGNLESARLEMDAEEQEVRDFLAAWRNKYGDTPVTSHELASACQLGGLLESDLPSDVDHRNIRQSLRYWLRSHRGQRHGDLVLLAEGGTGSKTWRVVAADKEQR